MVPAGTPCGHGTSLPSQSSPCRFIVFPPWTRDDDDDDDDKARHLEVKRHRMTKRDSRTGVRSRRRNSQEKAPRGAAAKRADSSSSTSSDDSDNGSDKKQNQNQNQNQNQRQQDTITPPISSPDAIQVPDPLALSSKPRPPPLPLPKNKEEFTPTQTLESTLSPLNTLERGPERGPPPGAVSKAEDGDDRRHREHNDKKEDHDENDEHEEQRYRANGPASPQSPHFSDFGPSFPMVTAPPGLGPPPFGDFPFPQSTEERKALQPVVTVTESAASSGTPAPADPIQTPAPMVVHHGLHSNAEKALIAVGSIGATVIVFFVAWFAWKCYKMHRRSHQRDFWQTRAAPSTSLDDMAHSSGTSRRSDFQSSLGLNRPKQFMMNLASRVPFLKERVAMRSWSNLDKQHDDAVWAEKRLPAQGHQRTSSGITVHTAIMTKSERGGESSATWSLPHQGGPMQRQSRPTPRSNNTLSGISDVSSLSSGFGDGDIIMPPAVIGTATTTKVTAVAVPPPVASRASVSTASRSYRDTVYTEASEDVVPRFRTINSWVRQQSGRIKRAKMTASDAPPLPNGPLEQDFRLMMPDNEEPRRVDETTSPSGYVDESEIIAGYSPTELASQPGYDMPMAR
ncbi:hypothetical protein L249_1613 [Ophiocordyceps polyrhachis-furcata BCC 54312]|uniref:Uncharacterized protein n=1 Tax=Ophiocordyceps polyrhachis-furcata BCC 54312 TaxID=1330021 RepID=A0A367KZP4_9HYPO|nr:hypothetical protein L249_1613 [Ophiocordyceps polyrhachis-furcata BCC 54312]